jgi:hypothetical protein
LGRPLSAVIFRHGSNWFVDCNGDRAQLLLPTTFYVNGNGSIGNDADDCLSSNPGGPAASIQAGVDLICDEIDANRQNIVLQCADGIYPSSFSLYNLTGWGTRGGHSELIIRGDVANPAAFLSSTGNLGNIAMVGLTTPWKIEGFKFQNTSISPAIACYGGNFVYLGKNDFGNRGGSHLSSSYMSFFEVVEPYAYTISGNANAQAPAFSHSLRDRRHHADRDAKSYAICPGVRTLNHGLATGNVQWPCDGSTLCRSGFFHHQ